MPTVVATRTNLAIYPQCSAGVTVNAGTGGAATTTTVTGASDGPLPSVTTYARMTVTTAKTSGSSGWTATSTANQVPVPNPQIGDICTVSAWVRYTGSGTITAGMEHRFVGAGTQYTDSAQVALPSGQWVRVSVTATANATYSKVAWWAFNPATSILPVGSTFDVTGVLIEMTPTLGAYFDGNTPTAMDGAYAPPASITYAWTGTPGASSSVMTETAPLQNYQVQLPNGAIAGAGTAVNLLSIAGLRDLASIRSGDEERPQADGSYPGLNYLGERVLAIKWELTLASSGVETALQTLATGFQNVSDPSTVCMTAGDYLRQQAGVGAINPVSALQIQLPGRSLPFIVFGRPTKHNVPIDTDYQYGRVQPVSEWTSPDGVLYDNTVVTATAGLPSPTSGMAWPASFPWTFGQSSGGTLNLNNTGNYPAKPLLVIQGPVSYPRITNTQTGQYISLNIVLGPTDVLVIDHQAGTVTLNASANRNNTVNIGSSFFTIAPGNASLGFSSGDSTAVTGTATGYILPTYSAA